MANEVRSAEFAIKNSYPASTDGIIVLLSFTKFWSLKYLEI